MELNQNTYLQSGKYRIIRVLGQGGFGITYLAEHTMLDKLVAIKEFFPKEYCDRDENTSHLTVGTKNSIEIVEMLKAKFIKEAKNISKLHHPNIITIHDIFQENDTAYYVMEYVEGVSLSQMVKEQGALLEEKALGYLKKVAEAVGYMHSLSMNHLDLKPANIMVRSSDDEPILIDFGLSKQYDASGGQTSTTPIGISHGFAPIEQYRPGGVSTFTPQTDIYALGATLYNLLSGSVPPHYSDILEDGLPELPSSVSHVTVTSIEKAMETKKTRRPSSIEEFLALLPDTIKDSKPQNLDNIQTDNSVSYKKTVDIQKANEEPVVKPIDKEKQKTEPKQKILEETVFLNVPLSNNIPTKEKNPHNEVATKVSINTELQYLDLGLSVKWATKLSGIAKPVMNDDVYKFQMGDGSIIRPNDFVIDYSLPTIKQYEELIKRCSWTTFQENGMHGYKIIGPNGNILMMPLGVLNRYISAECLKPDCLYYYFLYLGEYTHTLAKGVPTEANIWTVKG